MNSQQRSRMHLQLVQLVDRYACTSCFSLPSPSPSILDFNVTLQVSCLLEMWSEDLMPDQLKRTLLQKPKQHAFPRRGGFFAVVNLIEMLSKSAGCLWPQLKSGADLLRKAALGTGSNAKQPLSYTAATALGCHCHLLFCHIHHGTMDQEEEQHPVATLLEGNLGI